MTDRQTTDLLTRLYYRAHPADHAAVAVLVVENARLRAAIERIDGINDNPGDFNEAIDAVIRKIRIW